MSDTHGPRHGHRLLLAAALFLLAPLVGEFLLGNQPVTALPSLLLLAPMYGGGALLIRETARRAGRGWPTMILLGAAYALIEEGPVDQMLWNPHYGGFDMGVAYAGTHVPVLGVSVEMVQDVLSMHTVWSICVPIALVETFSRDRTRPWLGPVGLGVTGVVFAAGSLFLAVAQAGSEHFMASPARFGGAAAVIGALVVAAFAYRPRPASAPARTAPGPWTVGAVAFAASGLYWGREFLPDGVPAWGTAVAWCVLVAAVVALCAYWSRGRGWGASHRLALAGGALLTYVWVGFGHARDMGVPYATALVGDVVLGVGAIVLLVGAAAVVRGRTGAHDGPGTRTAPITAGK
ncbi:hypothetical protein ACFVTY_39105 [Streptomyces sp. NPDC058067]|uniref:hypothetical protein n=1 Tax=Streptomyces sp. NPDC058067 TaxID=3346324 RepID=UPI0036E02E39